MGPKKPCGSEGTTPGFEPAQIKLLFYLRQTVVITKDRNGFCFFPLNFQAMPHIYCIKWMKKPCCNGVVQLVGCFMSYVLEMKTSIA